MKEGIAIETPRGFRDIMPEEALKREKAKEIIVRNFKKYGFLPIETPIIEYEEIVKGDNEFDEAVSNIYKLKDRAERKLALRYEFTFQLSRLIKENPNIKLPFRRYQIGSVFRDEPVAPGRYREFTQCDPDIIGDSSINADAEILACVAELLQELKIKNEIIVNNRKLINSILENLGIENKEFAIREIDKIDKIGEDEVKKNLNKFIDKDKIVKLFSVLRKPLSFFTKQKFKGAEEIKELKKLCRLYGFEIKFSARLARGLSYYTGNVFEVISPDYKFTIAGGGRYDDKVGKYLGKKIPAVGISFGLDRVSELAKVKIDEASCLVLSIGKDKEAIKLAQKLRKQKLPVILMFGKPTRALEYADSYKIKYVIFIGKEETKRKKLKLRDMQTGKEEMLSEKELGERLQESRV